MGGRYCVHWVIMAAVLFLLVVNVMLLAVALSLLQRAWMRQHDEEPMLAHPPPRGAHVG